MYDEPVKTSDLQFSKRQLEDRTAEDLMLQLASLIYVGQCLNKTKYLKTVPYP